MRHPDLIGAWSLADTPNDYSGNGRNGTASNVVYGDVFMGGRGWNQGLMSSVITVPDNVALRPAQISVEAFIETPASFGSYPSIVSKVSSVSWNDGYGFLFNNDNTLRFCINNFNIFAGFALSTNTRYRILGTYDLQAIRLYIDGILRATTAYTATINHSTAALRICAPPSPDPSWSGKASYVRIWKKAVRPEDAAPLSFNLMPNVT